MKTLKLLTLALAVGLLSACGESKKKETTVEMTTEETLSPPLLTVNLSAKNNSGVEGVVVFTEEDSSVKMLATVRGLAPGDHAIHIHASADCSSDDGTSAGGHWNPTNKPHGHWGAETGYHKGDIGNFTADEKGQAKIVFTTNEWCIGCSDNTKNIVSKSVIIHAGFDDLTSQPSGNAGARVSCAGIIQ